jgi:hypothetical protein
MADALVKMFSWAARRLDALFDSVLFLALLCLSMSPIRIITILAAVFFGVSTVLILGRSIEARVTTEAQMKGRPDLRPDVALAAMPAVNWLSVQNHVLRYKDLKVEPWTRVDPVPPVVEDTQMAVNHKAAASHVPAECREGVECKWVDLATVPARPASAAIDGAGQQP